MSLFVFFISLILVAQHVSGNHVPIIRSWRLRDVIASCWYVPWLQNVCQDRLAGSASMDGFVARSCYEPIHSRREIKNTKVTSSWFFLSTLKGNFLNSILWVEIPMSKFQTSHGQCTFLGFEYWLEFMNITFSLELKML
jgi:hypothetical protein